MQEPTEMEQPAPLSSRGRVFDVQEELLLKRPRRLQTGLFMADVQRHTSSWARRRHYFVSRILENNCGGAKSV